MSDLVERLRAVSGCTQKTFMHRLDWAEGNKIIMEAADRIEALEKALRKVLVKLDTSTVQQAIYVAETALAPEQDE